MSQIPTVRVKNPTGTGYIIINQSDRKPHHELWHEQDASYGQSVGTHPDVTETTICLRLVNKLIAAKLGLTPVQWASTPQTERVTKLLAAEQEFDRQLVAYSSNGFEPQSGEVATPPVLATTLQQQSVSTLQPPVLEEITGFDTGDSPAQQVVEPVVVNTPIATGKTRSAPWTPSKSSK